MPKAAPDEDRDPRRGAMLYAEEHARVIDKLFAENQTEYERLLFDETVGHYGVACRMVAELTGRLLVEEQVPTFGDFVVTHYSSPRPRPLDIESQVVAILSMALARWKHVGGEFRVENTVQAVRIVRKDNGA